MKKLSFLITCIFILLMSCTDSSKSRIKTFVVEYDGKSDTIIADRFHYPLPRTYDFYLDDERVASIKWSKNSTVIIKEIKNDTE